MLRRLLLAAALALAPGLAHAQFATIGGTPATSDSSDKLATTQWVNNFFSLGIPLASGKIFIGSAGGVATAQTMSGDCTLVASGVITCTQAAGNFQVVGNLSVGGAIIDANGILATNIVAPATPAAGTTRIYVDSTTKALTFKNDAGTVGNAVVPSTCGANLFGTSISAAGVFGCTQPAIANISGFGTGVATALAINIGSAGAPVLFGGAGGTPSSITLTNGTGLPTSGLTGALLAAQEPAHTGDCTNTAGSLTLNCTKVNGVSYPASYTSGGIPFASATGAIGSSALLTANAIMLGGGVGVSPATLASLGATTTLLHGNAAGAPTFGSVVSADMNITTTGCTNQFVTAISAGGVGTCTTDTLAGAQHANQGTTTTVLHGNAAGNPAFGSIVSADLNITTTTCTNQFLSSISATVAGTCTAFNLTGAQFANQGTTTTVLHGNGAGNPTFGAVSLTTDVSGVTPVLNGGTGDTGAGWGAYTPTCAATTGTFTCTGRFLQIGKTVFVSIDILYTSAATGQLTVTIPAAGKTKVSLGGQRIDDGSSFTAANGAAGSSTLSVFASAGALILASGAHLIANGVYEAN